jgi:hypothetical protein
MQGFFANLASAERGGEYAPDVCRRRGLHPGWTDLDGALAALPTRRGRDALQPIYTRLVVLFKPGSISEPQARPGMIDRYSESCIGIPVREDLEAGGTPSVPDVVKHGVLAKRLLVDLDFGRT